MPFPKFPKDWFFNIFELHLVWKVCIAQPRYQTCSFDGCGISKLWVNVQFPNFPVRNETICKTICSADISSLAGIEYSYCGFVALRSDILKQVFWS